MCKELAGKRVAVLSDIHSNYHAFKACVADAKRRGAECFVFLGDYISDLADARKTLDLVYEIRSAYPTVCLRGNRERYMLEHRAGKSEFRPGSRTGSLLYTYQQLREEDISFFESLPIYDVIRLGGVDFEIAHAVQNDDRFYFEKSDESIPGIFTGMQKSWLLTGHSHKQYMQHCQGKTIINPGSVGVPRWYGYLTQYAMLNIENGDVVCDFYQLPYDLEAVVHAQFESGLMELAKHWAVSILYDVITGEEYTMTLLERVFQYAGGEEALTNDEKLWHDIAREMGMQFSEAEIVDICRQFHHLDS